MTSVSQHDEKAGILHRAVADHTSLKAITYTAAPTLQKKEDEDELQTKTTAQLKSHDEESSLQKKEDAPFPAINKTGMPDNLKAGIENLSGISLDDVKVHYNSDRPAQLNALAYAQGTEIHVGPGQERYLPHEAWHVVQQKQGRVRPTIQAKGVAINDEKGLEKEADVMGGKAVVSEMNSSTQKRIKSDILLNSVNTIIQGEFFEKINDNYTWHEEDPDDTYKKLSERRNYYNSLNPLNLVYGDYPVYTKQAVDRSGNIINGGLTVEESTALQQIKNQIIGTAYEEILSYIENRILATLGQSVLDQFYKGAHIVFKDDGNVYHEIFQKGQAIANYRKQSWSEWVRGKTVAPTPDNLIDSTTGKEGLGKRRPEKRQTSHYEQDALPQIGIDLPGNLTGHILTGLIPNNPYKYGDTSGNTFIQTEMYGFKTFYDKVIGHGKGFFWNFVASHQSGLIGFCKYSEKSQTEIREQDNPHIYNG